MHVCSACPGSVPAAAISCSLSFLGSFCQCSAPEILRSARYAAEDLIISKSHIIYLLSVNIILSIYYIMVSTGAQKSSCSLCLHICPYNLTAKCPPPQKRSPPNNHLGIELTACLHAGKISIQAWTSLGLRLRHHHTILALSNRTCHTSDAGLLFSSCHLQELAPEAHAQNSKQRCLF